MVAALALTGCQRRGVVEDAPVIWPRSAILQRAAASRVDLILGFTSRLREERDLGSGIPRAWRGRWLLNDVTCLQARRDVDGRVGDEQGAGVGRGIHDEE